MTEMRELIAHLESGSQVDPDGVMVTVSRHAVTEAVRLLHILGETEDALAACQSQAGGEIAWRDGLINEAKELLKVMPDHGLSARDFALWNRRRALFLGLHLWVGPYGAVRWTHCQTCGVIQRADGKNGPCRGPSRISTRKDDVLDAVGSIMACCESGQPHIPSSDDPTQCMVCGATVTVPHAEGER